jgi:hypothetical protein
MENEEKLSKLSKPMGKALGELIVRCEKSGIEYKWEAGFDEEYALHIFMQKGRGKHRVLVFDVKDARKLLDSDFKKYVFVEGYREAICCYKEGCVEAVVKSIDPRVDKGMILHRLMGISIREVTKRMEDGIDDRLELDEGGGKGVRISIGRPSKTLLAMLNYLGREEALSVRVEGLQITKNVEAAEQLGRVTNSLFFELRRKRDIELFVSRHYEVETSLWTMESGRDRRRESEVSFPKFEYDKQPIELYWHAVSAYKMPLLQYLAYYQILEYYFKKYSVLGAKKEISNCLKDPEFNADDDNDIVKIVTCVTGKLGPHVRENDLLRDTIRECVSEDDVVLELSSEPLKEYFKKEYKLVSQLKVSQENKEVDIRDQLAERIYDIRCRIVHTKEDDKRGRIMPFTKEEVLLRRFDLPLIETIADKVLIANSRKLSFR